MIEREIGGHICTECGIGFAWPPERGGMCPTCASLDRRGLLDVPDPPPQEPDDHEPDPDIPF